MPLSGLRARFGLGYLPVAIILWVVWQQLAGTATPRAEFLGLAVVPGVLYIPKPSAILKPPHTESEDRKWLDKMDWNPIGRNLNGGSSVPGISDSN